MNINNQPIITLSETEREAVQTLNKIVTEFADKRLCKGMFCFSCPLAMFCPFTQCAKDFEKTLNDIANLD